VKLYRRRQGPGGRCARPESFAEPSKIIKRTSSTISFLDDTEHQRFKQVTPEGSTLYIAAFGALRMPNDRSRIGCLTTAERFAP
jgi:hypothetical protein